MKLLMFSGSFHSNSRSLVILKLIQSMMAEHEFLIPSLNELPFYCEDLNKQKPDSVVALIEQVDNAEGIIVCTPEYNHSIPGVLKNAIDWMSRPAFNSPLKGKPISIITQAISPVGGARAQAHLKLVFDATLSVIQPCHEMMIAGIDTVLGPEMNLEDRRVMGRLSRHVNEFVDFIHGVKHQDGHMPVKR